MKTRTKFYYFLFLLFMGLSPNIVAQIDYSANTKGNNYTGYFLYGSNTAYINSYWNPNDVASYLIGDPEKNKEGVGANSLRPGLSEEIVENHQYDYLLPACQYYEKLGAKNNVLFIGYPHEKHRENRFYCSDTIRSKVFSNLYEPIWDKGENGTPVNDNNYYALYVYKLVKQYGKYIKFWEVWNEPDFTKSGNGDKVSGVENNWWDNDPHTCDLVNLRAPVQSYIRMMRISYEVIKSVDPDAFICVGGIGYPSFLDVILRNTDNPDGGKITAEFPLKGGAWFDCLSYHYYPIYSLQKWDNSIGNFRYFRHSDAAVHELIDKRKNEIYEPLLKKYEYDGTTFPKKEYIITETNIPRKQVKNFIGSDIAQRNYLMKAAIHAQKNGVHGIYVYCIADEKEENDPTIEEYHVMGLYKKAPQYPTGDMHFNNSGIAWRTISRQLSDRKYDKDETQRLNLPDDIDGGAFYSDTEKNYTYALWSKTTKDLDESNTSSYSFPSNMNVSKIAYLDWKNEAFNIEKNEILLTSTPVFIKLNTTIKTINVDSVSLETKSEKLILGTTLQLIAHILPTGAFNKGTTWVSSNPDVATVNNSGIVSALSLGTTEITVTTKDGSKTDKCTITVIEKPIPLSYFMLSNGYVEIPMGDSVQITVTFYPENATNKILHWSTLDANIATVNQNGIIQAVAKGETKIVVRSDEDSNKLKECIVKVKDPRDIGVSIEKSTTTNEPKVYVNNNILYIENDQTESVSVYSITGELLYSKEKSGSVMNINTKIFTTEVLIVKGSTGWSKKIILKK